jgi:BASS family bile acid:Na+ symporter
MTLSTLLILLIKTSLICLMLSLGLGLRLDALAEFRHRPWLILRVAMGSCVLVPLVALVVLKLPFTQDLSVGARFGIALMALSPSAPLTLRKASLRGGDHHLAALLQVVAALMAIVSIPLLSDLFRVVYGVRGWDISPIPVALQVAVVQVVPLSAGLLLRHWQPALARWAPTLQSTAFLVTLVVIGLILVKVSPELVAFVRSNAMVIPVMGLMTLMALAIGYGLAGEEQREKVTTALVTSMRNPGLAFLLAFTHGQQVQGVKLAIVSYLLVTILTSLPFLRWRRTQPSPG